MQQHYRLFAGADAELLPLSVRFNLLTSAHKRDNITSSVSCLARERTRTMHHNHANRRPILTHLRLGNVGLMAPRARRGDLELKASLAVCLLEELFAHRSGPHAREARRPRRRGDVRHVQQCLRAALL